MKQTLIVVEWLRRIFDPIRFPCFAEKFIHPNELVPLLSDAAAINYAAGLASVNPHIPAAVDVDDAE